MLHRAALRPRTSFALARALATKAGTVKAFEADQKSLVEAFEACSSPEEFFKLKDTKLAPLSKKLEELDSTMGWTYSPCSATPLAPRRSSP